MKATLSLLILLTASTISRGTLVFDWENTSTHTTGTATGEVLGYRMNADFFPLYFLDYAIQIHGLEYGTWTTSGWLDPWPSTDNSLIQDNVSRSGIIRFGDVNDPSHIPSSKDDLELILSQIPGEFTFTLDTDSYVGRNRRFPRDPIIGDLNGDLTVDAADAGIMFGNWTGDVASVPEPPMATLAMASILFTRTLSRRRYSQSS